MTFLTVAEHRLNFRLDSSSAPTRVRLHGGRSRGPLTPVPLAAVLAASEMDGINPITSPIFRPPPVPLATSQFQEPVK